MRSGISFYWLKALLGGFLPQKEQQNKFQQLYSKNYRKVHGYDPMYINENIKALDNGGIGLADGGEERFEDG